MAESMTTEEISAQARKWIVFACGLIAAIILFFVVVLGFVSPKMNLYKKNTEKQAVIAEQKAKSQAAEYAARSKVTQAKAAAQSERERAKGLRDAQETIAETLTEDYLQYLYINALADGNGQIIYVPTEAGLPVLEAGRATQDAPTGN